MTATTARRTPPSLAPGRTGTLAPEEYTTKPAPDWAPAYASTVAAHRDIDHVAVAFATDADKAATLIPEELSLLDIPALPGQSPANLVFAKYRECDLGPYMEIIVSIPVVHEGELHAYVPGIYVHNDAALLAGRELGGYPKKMAAITMRNYGDLFLSQMSRGSMQEKTADPNVSDLASSSVARRPELFSVPLPADETVQLPSPYDLLLPLPQATGKPQDFVLKTMALRRVPGVGPGPNGADGAEVLQLIASPWHVTKANVSAGGAPGMELCASQEDPIGELLPCNMVLGAFILRGDMYTRADEWTVVEDLKKDKPH
jgi:hypothetical protein